MKAVHIEGPLYAIRTNYFSPKLIAAAKATPGMQWTPELKSWCGYVDAVWHCSEKLRTLYNITCNVEKLPYADGWKHFTTALNPSYADAHDYQKDGIKFLISHAAEGCILADDMGLGKSLQSLRAARAFKLKTLIVCPAHIRIHWAEELHTWWPNAKLHEVWGVKNPEPIPSNSDVVICHYDILYAWVATLQTWGVRFAILDEAHAVASEKSRRSKAVSEIRSILTGCIGLTGTPMTNRPRDLHNVVNTVSPNRFGYFFTYAKEFCGAFQETVGKGPEAKTVWNFDGKSNEEVLHQRLSYMMLRRTKKEVQKELPLLTRQIVNLEVPARAQITPSFDMVSNRAAMRRALDLAADAKLQGVIDLLMSDVENNDGIKMVLFAHRRMFAEAIVDAMRSSQIDSTFIHGDVSLAKREVRRQEAIHSKGPHVLAATIDSCSTGIDFTHASLAVYGELSFDPTDLMQSESRLHRQKQTSPVLVKYVIARGTGDELVLQAVIRKLDTFERVVGDTGSNIKNDLDSAPKGDEALKRLHDTLEKMMAGKPAKTKKRKVA